MKIEVVNANQPQENLFLSDLKTNQFYILTNGSTEWSKEIGKLFTILFSDKYEYVRFATLDDLHDSWQLERNNRDLVFKEVPVGTKIVISV
jgi:hypothetical protein